MRDGDELCGGLDKIEKKEYTEGNETKREENHGKEGSKNKKARSRAV